MDWLLPPVFERLRGGRGEFLGEFRPAVALFLRFTGLDYDEDPQVGHKLDAYVRWVQSILKRYEGYLMQLTIGDKGSYLCAVFGAPVAHEDDPQRAAFAALELRCPPSSLGAGFDPQIGITRGVMRTGAYGGSQRRTYGVLSDEVNLAARLMQAAAPGQIIASKPVWAATLPAFTWEALPEIRVKGKAEPVTIFSLAGLKTHPSAPAKYFLPMVGRQAELSLAIQKLDLAASGRGQVLGIVAEAGIGKTRLIAEIVRLAEQRSLPCYTGECESYGADTSYLVWQNVWREFFNLDPNAEHEDQASSLQAQLAAIDPLLAARLPLLGTLLRLPVPDNDLTRSLDAKLRKTSLEALLVDCLRARALAGPPQVIVLEDCHWLDPLSQDLLDAIARAAMSLPVLLILAYRPEQLPHLQAPRVSKLSHFTGIHLAEFEPEEAERLIHLKLDQFFGEHAQAQPAFIEKIIERAGGNPFYIEELLNYLQDKGIGPLDYETLEQQDLPSSLNSLILSRIDQLTENQTAALKVASAIGRLFKAAMLWGVYPQLGEPSQVLTDLETLARLDLTQQESGEPEVAYLFKHVLTQEVTYESLQYATRAILHEHIGKYIEEHSAGALDQAVDLLAYHYERSQNTAKKREYLLKAGQAAQGKYANTTALHYYRRVLPLLSPAEQVGVMIKLGQVLELVG
ncbi:MAG TPA: AAA family ATPase, partial [Anaerolineales bacterium]